MLHGGLSEITDCCCLVVVHVHVQEVLNEHTCRAAEWGRKKLLCPMVLSISALMKVSKLDYLSGCCQSLGLKSWSRSCWYLEHLSLLSSVSFKLSLLASLTAHFFTPCTETWWITHIIILETGNVVVESERCHAGR
nr:hypothetical protein Iba_chr14dCG17240 [Ipomoea batatas]